MSDEQKVIKRKRPTMNQSIKLNKPSQISNYVSNDQKSQRKVENFGG